jgi:CRISPR-associated protein Cas1
VEKEDEKIADSPLIKIETILLYGNIQITTPALKMLLEEGVDVAFFSLSGRLSGMLNPIKSKNIILRLNHFAKARDAEFALQIAKQLVAVKINNMLVVLKAHLKNYSDPEVSAGFRNQYPHGRIVPSKRPPICGLEGAATRSIRGFGGFSR